jgi:hypothetical protein
MANNRNEVRLIRTYHAHLGGTLITGWTVNCAGPGMRRRLDAVILPDGRPGEARQADIDLTNRDVILVEARNSRLGCQSVGQILVKGDWLMEECAPRSLHRVVLVTGTEVGLEDFAARRYGIETVVLEEVDDYFDEAPRVAKNRFASEGS